MAWAGRRFGKTLVIMLGMNLASIALIATPLLVNAMKDWYFFLRLQVTSRAYIIACLISCYKA